MENERMIRFNHPYVFGREMANVNSAIAEGRLAGNGHYTKECHQFFKDRYGFENCLLTTSCTDALEMAAILLDIAPGDEVIVPSYTFVSSANAFVLRGANIVFVDSQEDNPNLDVKDLRTRITPRTKAVVVVHYGGYACQMDEIMALAKEHGFYVVEDAAQAIDATYKGQALGSIGHLAAFSFHETKNVICGEGGLLVINDQRFRERAEIIWEKGTNRASFYRGEIDKYSWVDLGSSFLPSDLVAAFLLGQLHHIEEITERRVQIWNSYNEAFEELENRGCVSRPRIPDSASNNGHLYYLVVSSIEERDAMLSHLKSKGIGAFFHYLSLHESPYAKTISEGKAEHLVNSVRFSDCLIRLPMHLHLSDEDIRTVVREVFEFFGDY